MFFFVFFYPSLSWLHPLFYCLLLSSSLSGHSSHSRASMASPFAPCLSPGHCVHSSGSSWRCVIVQTPFSLSCDSYFFCSLLCRFFPAFTLCLFIMCCICTMFCRPQFGRPECRY